MRGPAGLGPASLVLYDVSTLYFETDTGDGFREPGFSKERRLEPQITIGLLTDATGFPLAVEAFEGNKAETATMLPVINAFKAAHQLTDVTVVADAGMISEANQIALQASGFSFILGTRSPSCPTWCANGVTSTPTRRSPTGRSSPSPGRPPAAEKARGIPDRVVYYQYRHDRARRTLRGIDEQVAKAERAVDGHAPVKRNRFIKLTGATKSVNRDLEAKARGLAGLKGYTTNLTSQTAGVRHRRLPPALAHREELPHVQARPAGPTRLPPQTRIHRSPPDDRVRRAGRQPLHRTPNRLEHQEIRPNRPPLPHRPDQGRQTNPDRRRPLPDDLREAIAKINADHAH